LTILRGPAIIKLVLSPGTVAGCLNVTGKITLDQNAPTGGSLVQITNTNTAANAPASVLVPAGQKLASFTIATTPVTATKSGTLKATLGTSSQSKTLKVRPIGVKSVSLNPTSVTGGNSVAGTVTLECPAAPGDIVVTLSSTAPGIATPTVSQITIVAGQTTGSFTVSTTAGVSGSATIKAKANNITKSKKLKVNP
jgi:hypothetical protein